MAVQGREDRETVDDRLSRYDVLALLSDLLEQTRYEQTIVTTALSNNGNVVAATAIGRRMLMDMACVRLGLLPPVPTCDRH